jgi:hypothetical protein
MDNAFTLWECPLLKARLTRRQCATNQARAQNDALPKKRGGFPDPSVPPGRQECLTCQGVEWWASRTGSAPVTLLARDIVAELARREELRRRLRGAEAEAPAPPPVRRARAKRARAAAAASA